MANTLHKYQNILSWSIFTTRVKTSLQWSINAYLLINSLKQSLSLWWCLVIIWLSPSSSDSWPWHKNTKAISNGPCCQKQNQPQKTHFTLINIRVFWTRSLAYKVVLCYGSKYTVVNFMRVLIKPHLPSRLFWTIFQFPSVKFPMGNWYMEFFQGHMLTLTH